MKAFYKIENSKAQVGSGEFIPDGFIEYKVGEEPTELLQALEQDIAEQELQAKLDEAQAYLNNTDWYYARKAETGEEVPIEVIAKRQEAREFIRNNK